MTLDPVAKRLASAWGFEPTEELPGGFCSRVYADANQVLKVPFRGEEMTSGYWAMVRLRPPIGPAIYHSDAETGSILMERAIPGTKLHESGIDEQEQTHIWAEFARAFRMLPTDRMMPMSTYYANSTDPLVDYLLPTTGQPCALHGDLHHENILHHGDRWMCIDAKGLLGDPAIEGAAFVCNPYPAISSMPPDHFVEKISIVAERLDVPAFRVWAWSVARMREEPPVPGDDTYGVLKSLYGCAAEFDAERFVLPLA